MEEFDGGEELRGEGIGAELIRIIRQISQARARILAIEREIAKLLESEIGKLKRDAEKVELQGRDLLHELATTVRQQIESLKSTFEKLSQEG